jgi:hypothetical protein
MKRIILTSSFLFLCFSIFAAVWRLNNIGANASISGTLQDAINYSSPGDTIHVEPSSTSYGSASITKNITLIGAGYWLTENDSTQANTMTSLVGSLTFSQGSEGSKICGLYIEGRINIQTDNITISRNYINQSTSSTSEAIYINGSNQNIKIIQNWINGYASTTGDHIIGIESDGSAQQEIEIHNNFIRTSHGNTGIHQAIVIPLSSNGVISIVNNNIWGNLETTGAYIANNIQLEGGISGAGNTYYNNLGITNQFPSNNGNIQNAGMGMLFIDYDSYVDNGYILNDLPGVPSLATGAGLNGGDCGVFGYHTTGTPYKLSGLPDIPAIFEFSGNLSNGVGPVQINIKAKSHN